MLLNGKTELCVWEGFKVYGVERKESDHRQIVRLCPIDKPPCPHCGHGNVHRHQVHIRRIRDLPILERQTWLEINSVRYRCLACCKVFPTKIPWIDDHSRVTRRLADMVGALCAVMSIKHVAAHFKLHWTTVKNLDKAYLTRQLQQEPAGPVRLLGMDEFALHTGHRYATTVVDLERKQVLWVGIGRGRKDIVPFFESRTPEWLAGIKAVAMDMTAAYKLEINRWCPQAEIVYDLYHVMAKYGREVIDRTRVDQANRLRTDRKARAVIKGSRWLLLRNKENITRDKDRVQLSELLAANKPLLKTYVMREELKALWTMSDALSIQKAWDSWFWKATHSRVEALRIFAHRLRNYVHGIVSRARWKIHTGTIEGINNRIKVIKRMAYGFRDADYFFLKIRAAFHHFP